MKTSHLTLLRHSTSLLVGAFLLLLHSGPPLSAADLQGTTDLESRLTAAGENRAELERALAECTETERVGMRFLIENMPEKDLSTLKADFLVAHVRHAYQSWQTVPWRAEVPEEIFLNAVLPYANVNERRDDYRADFAKRFGKYLKGVDSPGKAAAILNQKVFPDVNVKYSTKRPKADQSPYESIEAGLASCTGLSILHIAACRSLGVPARFVGIPRWPDNSGNHSWVEIWSEGSWHFTGAAEPTGDRLNEAWFKGRASKTSRANRLNAIYAVSFRRTPLRFPLVWNSDYRDLSAVDVTDRYTSLTSEIPEGKIRVRFRLIAGNGRRSAALTVHTPAGDQVFAGETKDERFDANDHLTAYLDEGARYVARATSAVQPFVAQKDEQLITLRSSAAVVDGSEAITALRVFLAKPRTDRGPLEEQGLAGMALTRAESTVARTLLWDDRLAELRETRRAEMRAKVLVHGDERMPFHYEVYGEAPAGGRSLYISMHGGGGAPARVNDQQWENQKRLYQPTEGVYLAPRAPTNTWNLWHQGHIDPLFDRLITNLVVLEGVNPDRVYLMGYSAGGDGVFQLAPRMADRFAAAAMMAGHPNETSPLGLRNLPFTIHMGGKDAAYDRNKKAAEWRQELAKLRKADPEGYPHRVVIYPDKGHWMDREDAVAVEWMATHERRLAPKRVVWVQDDVTHDRLYWLAIKSEDKKARTQLVAQVNGQKIELESEQISQVRIRLRDDLLNLDQPVQVTFNGTTVFDDKVDRTILTIDRTLRERNDPAAVYPAEAEVARPARASF